MIASKDISVVFQGKAPTLHSPEYPLLIANIAQIRHLLPDSPILLGTWEGIEVPKNIGIDHITFSKDPGPLPSFKKNSPCVANNINRQLLCSAQVLNHVKTKYVIKLRLDCTLQHLGFLKFYARYGLTTTGGERLLVPSFFTLDPRMYEQMSFHISDWFVFGPSEKVQKLWSAPYMTVNDATYYDRHPVASHSSYFAKLFRSRLAIEQHLATHYAEALGYTTPLFHNDITREVLDNHDQFVARELLILNLDQMGMTCQKYKAVRRSSFQKLNCLTFLDWYLLNINHDPSFVADPKIYRAALRFASVKKWMRAAHKVSNPLMPLIKQRFVKGCVSKVLRGALSLHETWNKFESIK